MVTHDGNTAIVAEAPVVPQRQYSTLREWAYHQLREMIITGDLAPGSDIHEGRLCAMLKISKSPLREALRQLAQEGLVIAAANRGSFVSTLVEEDISEIYQIRLYLEVMAVRLACARQTPEQIAALRANVAALEGEMRHGRVRAIAERDVEFHLLLGRMAGHRRLLHVQEDLQVEMLRLVMQQFADWGEEAESDAVRKHAAIVDAIEAGDEEAAVAWMREHLQRGERFRRAVIARNDGRLSPDRES